MGSGFPRLAWKQLQKYQNVPFLIQPLPSLHTAPRSQPGGRKANCQGGITFVRLANPPSHKTGKQISLAFLA